MKVIKRIVLVLLCSGVIQCLSTTLNLNSTWWIKPISFMYPIADNVSEVCKNDTMEYLSSIQNQSLWALKMMDASGRLQSGLLSSNIRALGSFDQCLSIRNPLNKFVGKYCLLELDFGTHFDSSVFDWSAQEYFKYYIKEVDTEKSQKYFPTLLTGKWALCVPSSCSIDDINIFGVSILNRATKNMNLSATVSLRKNDCSTALSSRPYEIIDYITLIVFGITLFMIIVSTVISYFLKKDQRKTMFTKLVCSFSVIDNWNQWLEINSSRSLQFLEGIRALAALDIVLYHERQNIFLLPYLNLEKLMKDTYNYTYSPLWFSADSVDVFFLISGVLRSYSLIKNYDQGKFEIIKPLVRRYLRITPTYAFVILFYATIHDRITNGPDSIITKIHSKSCRRNWWHSFLYINNYTNFNCLSQSWYLAADFQMFFVAPLLIYPLWKWNILGKSIFSFALIISCTVPIASLYDHGFPSEQLFFTAKESHFSLFYKYIYERTHTRMSPYLVGIWMGFVLSRNKTINVSKAKLRIGWFASVLAILLKEYWKIILPVESYTFWEKFEISIYNTFGRLAFSVAIVWMIYACYADNNGLITRFLSCNTFMYLGKISFCLYLIHLGVFSYNLGINQTLAQAHAFVVIRDLIGDFGICLFVSLLLHIFIESPFSNITEIFFANSNINKPQVTDEKRS